MKRLAYLLPFSVLLAQKAYCEEKPKVWKKLSPLAYFKKNQVSLEEQLSQKIQQIKSRKSDLNYKKFLNKELLNAISLLTQIQYKGIEISGDQFKEIQEFTKFLEGLRKNHGGEYNNKKSKDYKAYMVWSFKFEEQLSRYCANSCLDEASSLMEKWSQQTERPLLSLNARKYLWNIEHPQSQIGDSILPINFDDFQDRDIDIVFIPGQQSHPLRSWRVYSHENQNGDRAFFKCWLNDLLIPDLTEEFPGKKFRILALGYDSKGSAFDLAEFGIPDRTTYEISEQIRSDLRGSKVYEKPVIFVVHSMGGLVLKLVLKDDDCIRGATNSVLFVGTPHLGSDVLKEVQEALKTIVPGFQPFQSHGNSISEPEFVERFFSELKVTATTSFTCQEDRTHLSDLHNKFLSFGIPFECITEVEKVHYPTLDVYYRVVEPQSALVQGARTHIRLEGKNHQQIAKVTGKDDPSYQVIKDFLFKQINELM